MATKRARTPARRTSPDAVAHRPGDVFHFTMDYREIVAAAAGRVPGRIRRACYAVAPLITDGDRAEADRRAAAIPDYRRLWALVSHVRDALYRDGLLSAAEYQTLLDFDV